MANQTAHLFRREAGRLVSTLTRIFGSRHLDLAEEVVQDALLKALEQWPLHGVPENPSAWLIQVARHRALDVLRRQARLRGKTSELLRTFPAEAAPHAPPPPFDDDRLQMMFVCCHPALSPDARAALTLKTACGFGTGEIARAFLASEATIAQRLVRARRYIRDHRIPFDMPEGLDLQQRLDSVLEVVYLIFNEGYRTGNHELCEETIRLATLLLSHRATALPKCHALLALFYLTAARLGARSDPNGEWLLLADQDRSLWHQDLLEKGFRALDAASSGEEISTYHLEAGIAAAHAAAPSLTETDWTHILQLYDDLLARNPSPVVALNRAVATAHLHGPQAALDALAPLENEVALRLYAALPATLAGLHSRLGNHERAAYYYRMALERPVTEPERRFFFRSLEQTGRTRL